MSGCVFVCLNTGWVCFVCMFREAFCAKFFMSVLLCLRCLAVSLYIFQYLYMCVCVSLSLSVYKSLSPYIYWLCLSIHLPVFHVHSPSLLWDISAVFICRLCLEFQITALLSICKCYQKLKCSLYL